MPIVTLLMVIVLQHTQNRDTQSLQIKLNELLLALEEPDDQIIHAGRLGDEELDDLDPRHTTQAESRDLTRCHSMMLNASDIPASSRTASNLV